MGICLTRGKIVRSFFLTHAMPHCSNNLLSACPFFLFHVSSQQLCPMAFLDPSMMCKFVLFRVLVLFAVVLVVVVVHIPSRHRVGLVYWSF